MNGIMQEAPVFEEEATIDLRQYISLLRQWAWLIILSAALAGGAAFWISRQMTPIFQASTTLLINEAPSTKITDYSVIQTSQSLARTYAALMQKRPVLEGVIDQLGLTMTPEQVGEAVSVTPVRDTQLIEVKVEDPNPKRAEAIANTLVGVFATQIQETQAARYAASKESLQTQMNDLEAQINTLKEQLAKASEPNEVDRLEGKISQYEQSHNNLALSYEQVRLTEAQNISSAVQVEEAIAPGKPIKPKTMQNTLLGAVVGVLLAVGGIFLIEALDDSIKDPEEITRQFGLPILAMIEEHKQEAGLPAAQREPRSPMAEAFRVLRTNVAYAGVDKPIRRLLVTSPTPKDGKSTVVANLAAVVAQSGKRVTVLEADLHRPRVHTMLGLGDQVGLSTLFLEPGSSHDLAIQPTEIQNLRAVASGSLPPNPSELLGSLKMIEILEWLDHAGEMTVIDTPPVLSVTDAVVLAGQVDGVLLVVRPGSTNIHLLKQAVEQLRRVGANLIGVVLNQVESKRSRYRYYYRTYGCYHAYRNGNGHTHSVRKNGSSHKKGKALLAKVFGAPVGKDQREHLEN